MLCSSSHLVKTALNAETLDAAYVKYASFLKPWSKTTHFRDGSGETYRVLRSIKGNRVLHWHLQYAWNMSFSTVRETKLLDAEFDRSKTCFIISFSKWTKLVNRNMKLHNVSHKRSLSQSVSAFSCISFTLMTIDVSCSSKIEKLPSNYSSESAEWKVLHGKKKWQTFFYFIWSISQNSVHATYATTLFQVGEFAKIVLWVLVFLGSHDRAPFCLGFVSVIYHL